MQQMAPYMGIDLFDSETGEQVTLSYELDRSLKDQLLKQTPSGFEIGTGSDLSACGEKYLDSYVVHTYPCESNKP